MAEFIIALVAVIGFLVVFIPVAEATTGQK